MTDRYYIINQHGVATLCADLQDATSSAAEADEVWPTVAPHRVAVMLPLGEYWHKDSQTWLDVGKPGWEKCEIYEMSETTKTPRAHAEMAARFMADSSLKCWVWGVTSKCWLEHRAPEWHAHLSYHVGHEAPTEPPKRKVTMAGITFDAPETEAPKVGAKYWLEDVELTWSGDQVEHRWLANGLIHLDRENARLHAQARRELNRQLCGLEAAE